MALPAVGIIGMGYLGWEIARLAGWSESSWGTRLNRSREISRPATPITPISFDWRNPDHWEKLPSSRATLILTVPPIDPDPGMETGRLRYWCEWMRRNRPGCDSLVYISTTGVYPDRDGEWHEASHCNPESLKGQLRLATEKTLGDYFHVRTIRPGAIYGPGRNIGERILAGKPIPSGNQPVHRIHVTDLARIVRMAVSQETFPPRVNAVDTDPAPTRAVAEWLLNRYPSRFPTDCSLNLSEGLITRTPRTPAEKRFVSNRILVETCGYQWVYPSYQEGLQALFHPE